MNQFVLILYGVVNIAMVAFYLRGRGQFNHFPFWAGVIALGWFFPQAFGVLAGGAKLPPGCFSMGIGFASLCTLALWLGYGLSVARTPKSESWLSAKFYTSKLYFAGAFLCIFGFFFEWKLSSLPKELLNSTQWTGAPVKYLFFANVFRFGFITIWLLYCRQGLLLSWRMLIFIIPSLALILKSVILHGRRAEMMDLVAFIFVSLWFARRIALPRWAMIAGLAGGLILINAIGMYRSIMGDTEVDLRERLVRASQANYLSGAEDATFASNIEVRNYLFYRQVYADMGSYDYGMEHWNSLIFNYVPGQIVGHALKDSLMIPLFKPEKEAYVRYGHKALTGSTSTGYRDAFGSFGWFGFIKFWWIGWVMGILYRHAYAGDFFGQLLYVYALSTAMHGITHGTNDILIRIWIYFLLLGFPALYFAMVRPPKVEA